MVIKNPLFIADLENLYIINQGESRLAINNAINDIQDFGIGSLVEKNEKRYYNFIKKEERIYEKR